MSTTLTGELHGTDTKDTITKMKEPRTYDYRLKASGGGTLRFKIECFYPPLLGESGSGTWGTLEDRSRIASGTTLDGSFVVPEVRLSSSVVADKTEVKFIFSRGALTDGVDYELYYEYV